MVGELVPVHKESQATGWRQFDYVGDWRGSHRLRDTTHSQDTLALYFSDTYRRIAKRITR